MGRAAALLACLALGACGFRPLYGHSNLAPQMALIYVEPIADRDGYELRNTLINLLEAVERPSGLSGPPRLVPFKEVGFTVPPDR